MVDARDSSIKHMWIGAFSVMLLMLLVYPSAAHAQIVINNLVSRQVFSEPNDFPSRLFADPWDMSEWTDMSNSQYYSKITNFKFKGGVLSGRTTGHAYFHPLFPGYRDGYPLGRDGEINKIDTSKYNSVSFRMYSSKRTIGQVHWLYNTMWTKFGVNAFRVKKGWHTYSIDLAADDQWVGKPMGFRFTPAYEPDVHFKVDWMRLYQKSKRRVSLEWNDSKPGSRVLIYLDRDRVYGNNKVEKLTSRTSGRQNTYTWNPSPYKPGSYYFYLKKAGEPAVYSKRILINRVPLITILNPDDKGGKDYASVETGNPWDMNGPNDIEFNDYLTDIRFKDGIMSAKTVMKNPGQKIGEGFFHLRVPKPIDTNKYHRLTFRYRYDGYFDFGLGTMARAIWGPDWWDLTRHSTSDAIITYPRWTTYTMDLKKMPIVAGNIGWNGLVREFRFDPLEVSKPWRFYVDYIRLSADDWANRGMTIQWNEGRLTPRPTKVAIYYDTNRSGFNGRLIAKGLKSVSGKNSYKWNTKQVPEGKYWIHIAATDGVSSSKVYSTGPVVIEH